LKQYTELTEAERESLLAGLRAEYENKKAAGLKLDMSRGKPNADQLAFSLEMLATVGPEDSIISEDGINCGNYQGLDGIAEAKRLMAEMMGADANQVFVGGNSSLNLMHDVMTYCWLFALPGCETPWGKQEAPKFICPVPGYDRHFAVSGHFGLEMPTVAMTETGPDMDAVEELIKDPSVKGMWCMPVYSNPQGHCLSEETIHRLAAMKPAAKDFRIFCDNAYPVHNLYADQTAAIPRLLEAFAKHGHEDNIFVFASTSKVSFPGAGVAAIAASKANMDYIKSHMTLQTIGYDKLNMLRHARFFKDMAGITRQMEKHAEKLRPKFELVHETLERELGGLGFAEWTKPLGGYFISIDVMPGTAKRVVALCKETGLVMTPAGATHPHGIDPEDKTIRIAPSFPGLEELAAAGEVFCLCVKLAALEKLQDKS
jgi:aspartate/methionine/tyrosine aminotransferase